MEKTERLFRIIDFRFQKLGKAHGLGDGSGLQNNYFSSNLRK